VERKERRKRVRWFLLGLLARPLLFAAWCFVIWGTLLAVLVAFKSLEVGVGAALRAAVGGGSVPYSWANALAITLALVVWPTVVCLHLLSRRSGD
jgi:putative flippase GtrA